MGTVRSHLSSSRTAPKRPLLDPFPPSPLQWEAPGSSFMSRSISLIAAKANLGLYQLSKFGPWYSVLRVLSESPASWSIWFHDLAARPSPSDNAPTSQQGSRAYRLLSLGAAGGVLQLHPASVLDPAAGRECCESTYGSVLSVPPLPVVYRVVWWGAGPCLFSLASCSPSPYRVSWPERVRSSRSPSPESCLGVECMPPVRGLTRAPRVGLARTSHGSCALSSATAEPGDADPLG